VKGNPDLLFQFTQASLQSMCNGISKYVLQTSLCKASQLSQI